ncbi:MAG TPA: winged helix-turn-helix domain-containing protein [Blastocatellia bacterium]|nr:winged helix-turn-helix domain-containing protein [Blastocatellia bacterium]HMV84609.1 winged helix-turn-helix domain-containing protein [Blastocatellia bacterium]HMX25018.1 winged helix-turn-helix domain-containing protein [Blastocatellia bacterium]HMY74739.1 winged helix-turn-helix domain-containing protein [Blastocatellia bacterium]HMZ20971.1 winged helix-turn-helix domain-containing protein [Blastocatellia bacterium]
MKPSENAEHPLRFGEFELRLQSEELYRNGAPVKLPPQPFKVLALLLANAGQLVTREELRQAVWGEDTFVDFDKGLNFCIKQIRESLGDNAQTPLYIETLPRRGYRFIAPVERAAETAVPENAAVEIESKSLVAANSSPKRRRLFLSLIVAAMLALTFYAWRQRAVGPVKPAGKVMLAVLPFENLNADAEQDYFSDGLTEEMITQLGRLRPRQLGVIARTTALTYKKTKKDIRQIAQELGVGYVLEGSVRRETGRVRITTQLIQAGDQTHLWAETFDRNEGDLLQIQSEVAARVARSLALELLAGTSIHPLAGKTSRPEVYDAYLKGRYLIIKDTLADFARSIPFFEQAIAKDPNFAPAYVGLVEAQVLMATWQNTPAGEVLPKVKPAALKAVELDPALAEAYAALATVNFWLEWNWQEAGANFQRAIELNPSNPHIRLNYAAFLSTQGRTETGVEQVKQALQLDPVSLLTNGLAAFFYLRAGHFDDAIVQGKIMLEIEPDSPSGHYCLYSAYGFKGMYGEAMEVIRRQMRKSGEKEELIQTRTGGDARTAFNNLCRENLRYGKKALAEGKRVSATFQAISAAQLGETQEAFAWLEKAFAAREPSFVYFKIHPGYANLRGDPRFADLARRANLAY